jgi:hypothetical protein
MSYRIEQPDGLTAVAGVGGGDVRDGEGALVIDCLHNA